MVVFEKNSQKKIISNIW